MLFVSRARVFIFLTSLSYCSASLKSKEASWSFDQVGSPDMVMKSTPMSSLNPDVPRFDVFRTGNKEKSWSRGSTKKMQLRRQTEVRDGTSFSFKEITLSNDMRGITLFEVGSPNKIKYMRMISYGSDYVTFGTQKKNGNIEIYCHNDALVDVFGKDGKWHLSAPNGQKRDWIPRIGDLVVVTLSRSSSDDSVPLLWLSKKEEPTPENFLKVLRALDPYSRSIMYFFEVVPSIKGDQVLSKLIPAFSRLSAKDKKLNADESGNISNVDYSQEMHETQRKRIRL